MEALSRINVLSAVNRGCRIFVQEIHKFSTVNSSVAGIVNSPEQKSSWTTDRNCRIGVSSNNNLISHDPQAPTPASLPFRQYQLKSFHQLLINITKAPPETSSRLICRCVIIFLVTSALSRVLRIIEIDG